MAGGGRAEAGFPDLGEASNVMLFAPTGAERVSCFDPLERADVGETHVLVVSYTRRPAAVIEAWETQIGTRPATAGVVTVGQPERGDESQPWAVSRVGSPGDLTGTGIELSERISAVADDAGADEGIVVCFDSVTELLEHADVQRVFRFLHVLTGRVRNAGARCYYRFDPDSHDERAIATLRSLFDATVERGDDGWTVER